MRRTEPAAARSLGLVANGRGASRTHSVRTALTDRRGFALDSFTADRSASSTCYGGCAAAWPPYLEVCGHRARGYWR